MARRLSPYKATRRCVTGNRGFTLKLNIYIYTQNIHELFIFKPPNTHTHTHKHNEKRTYSRGVINTPTTSLSKPITFSTVPNYSFTSRLRPFIGYHILCSVHLLTELFMYVKFYNADLPSSQV